MRYRVTEHARVEPAQAVQKEGYHADTLLSSAWADAFVEIIAKETARTQNELSAKLHAEISELRTKLAIVEALARGDLKMLPAPKGRADAA
jgi:hypothetical protein